MKGLATLVWIAIAAVIIAGAGGYLYLHPGALGNAGLTSEEGGQGSPETTFTSSLTAEELIGRKQNLTCTYAFDSGNAKSTGTVYVANGMMRGDFETNAAGQVWKSHVVLRDSTSYIWMDGMAEGFKSPITGAVTTGGGNSAPDINSKLDYTCAPWTPDQSMFTLPGNVEFKAVANPASPS